MTSTAPRRTAIASHLEGRVRWLMVFLLFLAGMINYMDRAALSVAAPLVVRDERSVTGPAMRAGFEMTLSRHGRTLPITAPDEQFPAAGAL